MYSCQCFIQNLLMHSFCRFKECMHLWQTYELEFLNLQGEEPQRRKKMRYFVLNFWSICVFCVVLSCHHLSKFKVYFSVYNIIFPMSTVIILCHIKICLNQEGGRGREGRVLLDLFFSLYRVIISSEYDLAFWCFSLRE